MRVKRKKLVTPTTVILFVLSFLLLCFSVAVVVSAYQSGSDLIANPTLRRALSDYFQKSARSITREDLSVVRAIKVEKGALMLGKQEILDGLKRNYALEVTDTESVLDLEKYYYTIPLQEPLTDFSDLALFEEVEYLSVYNSSVITSLEQVCAFENLYELEIWTDSMQPQDLAMLNSLEKLEVLTLSELGIRDLSPLSAHPNLIRLNLTDNEITDLSALAELEKLRVLSLPENQIQDVFALSGLTKLEYLDLSDNCVSDISPLSQLVELRQLDVSNSEKQEGKEHNAVSDLSAVSGMKKLQFFYANANPIASLEALSSLEDLAALSLSDCQVTDAAPLSGLESLTYLSLQNNDLSDVSAFLEMKNLDYLFLRGNENLVKTQPLKELEDTYIDLFE